MRINRFCLIVVVILAATGMFTVQTAAQDGPFPRRGMGRQQNGMERPPRGARLLRQLGLSSAQMQQIRSMNMERRPLMQDAQRRFRQASRSLDTAIYSDQVNEAEIQARIKDVQMAQAELIKIRSMNELSIRKILTPEQLIRFRQLRQRFDDANAIDPYPGERQRAFYD